MATWASVKQQAAEKLGLAARRTRTSPTSRCSPSDPYGEFIPGPNGLPQYVTTTVAWSRANLAATLRARAERREVLRHCRSSTDIAHNADPVADTDCDQQRARTRRPRTRDTHAVGRLRAAVRRAPTTTRCSTRTSSPVTAASTRTSRSPRSTRCSTPSTTDWSRTSSPRSTIRPTRLSRAAFHDVDTTAVPLHRTTPSATATGSSRPARFVTEMEYQHLVFEEFGRKVQPAIRAFHVYSPDINPAVQAEFAHASRPRRERTGPRRLRRPGGRERLRR